jgi:hypothetical protein
VDFVVYYYITIHFYSELNSGSNLSTNFNLRAALGHGTKLTKITSQASCWKNLLARLNIHDTSPELLKKYNKQ